MADLMKEQKVFEYIHGSSQWKKELELLRNLNLEAGLEEDFKWRIPVFTYTGKNITSIFGFKDCCAISFFKGSLLKDPENILQKPGENSEYARMIKFTSVQQIVDNSTNILQYIHEAIIVEKSGIKVQKKELSDYQTPKELQEKFNEFPAFEQAFHSLSPGRQKGYLLYFSSAKNSETIKRRIDANYERILSGYGIHDCTCGHSKRPPNCDGSHKNYPSFTKI